MLFALEQAVNNRLLILGGITQFSFLKTKETFQLYSAKVGTHLAVVGLLTLAMI